MTEIVFDNPARLYLLWAIAGLLAVAWYASRRGRAALYRFATPEIVYQLIGANTHSRHRWKTWAACAAMACLIIALAGPRWNRQFQREARTGRDVVFLLDASNSMLAEDVHPSRLERSKLAISECVDQLAGDRVALVAFAGEAVIRCPLTIDYGFFHMMLQDVRPELIGTGGTRIGDALDTTIEKVLTDGRHGFQDVILITDGEDQESAPSEAAAKLAESGTRLIAIGIGDDREGERIPQVDEQTQQSLFMTHGNREVWSRLQPATLREIVAQTPNGVYLNVGTGALDLAGVYRQLIATAGSSEVDVEMRVEYQEKYSVFLTMAFLLMFVVIGSRDAKPRKPSNGITISGILLAALLFGSAETARAESLPSQLAAGEKAYAAEEYNEAQAIYEAVLENEPGSAIATYNLANTYYRQNEVQKAAELYEELAGIDESSLQTKSLYNMGNCLFRLADLVRESDPHAALNLYVMSERAYWAVVRSEHGDQDAAYNLEVARRTARVLNDEIQQQAKDQQEQLDQMLDALRELIERQEAVISSTRTVRTEMDDDSESPEAVESLKTVTDEQETIRLDTLALAEMMSQSDFSMVLSGLADLLDSPGESLDPLMEARLHVESAASAQGKSVESLKVPDVSIARVQQFDALRELRLALEAMPQGEPQEGDESNDESGEPSDETGDQEYEDEGEWEEEGDQPYDEPPEPGEMTERDDLEFTAPEVSPEELLAEEQQRNMQRERKRASHIKPVEKDW